MLLHNKMAEIAIGDLLSLVATDPSTQRDVPKFCRFLFYVLVEAIEQDSKFYYLIRKGAD